MEIQRSTYRRILVTRMKFIGDVVLTTPVLTSLREACPDAFIAYMGDKNAVTLLEQNPHLNEIIPYDFSRPTLLEEPRVAWLLRRRRFDIVIDLFGNPRSALLSYLSGARVRIGPARKGRGRLYTIQVHDDGSPKTAIEYHNRYIMAAGIPPSAYRTEIFLSSDELREARIYLQWLGPGRNRTDPTTPLIGIHPGATWPAKRWLPERFAELADLVAAKLGARVLMTAGPMDSETTETVLRKAVTNIIVVKDLPLRQLAAVISHCSVFVSNDAAPMHIAAAVRTPTIGIFGPGEENIWFPYSADQGHQALRKNVPCHPCHLDFCNRKGDDYMECMKLLGSDEAFAAVERALGFRRGNVQH